MVVLVLVPVGSVEVKAGGARVFLIIAVYRGENGGVNGGVCLCFPGICGFLASLARGKQVLGKRSANLVRPIASNQCRADRFLLFRRTLFNRSVWSIWLGRQVASVLCVGEMTCCPKGRKPFVRTPQPREYVDDIHGNLQMTFNVKYVPSHFALFAGVFVSARAHAAPCCS